MGIFILLIINRFPVPEVAAAVNILKLLHQQTQLQLLSAGDDCINQLNPSELLIMRLPVPDDPTTIRSFKSKLQHI